MKRSFLFMVLVALLVGACGGGGKAKVKGRLVENGSPLSFAVGKDGNTRLAVQFIPIDTDGLPSTTQAHTAVLNKDGSFELVASGGEIPTGEYQVAIQAVGTSNEKLKAITGPTSPVRRKLVAGVNDLTIDVAKPKE